MAKKNTTNNKVNQNKKINTQKQQITSSSRKSDNAIPVVEISAATKNKKNTVITFDQIAMRAKNLWEERGCQTNQDEKNWYDAENQLKEELGIC